MKNSGNKIMMIVSAVIIGSTLMVPVLPADYYLLNDNPTTEEKNTIQVNSAYNTNCVLVDFSKGRELSIRL